MVSTNTTLLTDNALKSSGFTSGVLSALSTDLQASGMNNGFLAELLSQTSSTTTNVNTRVAASDLVQGSTALPKASNPLSTFLSNEQNLHDVLAALRKLANQIAASQGSMVKDKGLPSLKNSALNEGSQHSQLLRQQSANATQPNPSTTQTETSTKGSTVAVNASINAATSSSITQASNANGSALDPNQNLSNILMELQKLVAWLSNLTTSSSQPGIANANGSLGTDLSKTLLNVSMNTPSAVSSLVSQTSNSGGLGQDSVTANASMDPNAFKGVLQDLLSAAQLLQKQIAASSTTALQNPNSTSLLSANVTPNDLQMQVSSIVDTLKNFISTTSTPAAVTSLQAQTPQTNTIVPVNATALSNFGPQQSLLDTIKVPVAEASQPTPTLTTASSTNNTSSSTNENSQSSANNFFSSMTNFFGPLATPHASPLNQDNSFTATNSNSTSTDANIYTDKGPATPDGSNTSTTALDLTSNGINPLLTATGDTTKTANPYSFASQLSASRPTLGTTGLPNAVEQVIFQMNRSVRAGQNQMTLQLQPADLGRINIRLDFASDGKVQGKITADNPVTLDLLSKDVGSLARVLQEAGLHADQGSLQFSLGGQAGNNSSQTTSNNSSSSSNATSSTETLSTEETNALWDAQELYTLTPNRVNFKV